MNRKLTRKSYKPKNDNTERKSRNISCIIISIFAIFAVALIIRLNPIIRTPEMIRSGFGPFGDTHFYHRTAYNLYKGNGFSATYDDRAYGLSRENENLTFEPTAIRGPVYTFFISTIYKLLGNEKDMESPIKWRKNLDKVRIVQCIMDASICFFVFFIVRLICPSSLFPAFLASILYCFCFYSIFFARALLSESITTFILTCLVFFCLLSLKSTRKLWWLITGVFLGLVVLSRFEYSLFVPVLTSYIYFVNRKFPAAALQKCIFLIVGTMIIVSPWTLRNYLVFKKFIPVSAGSLGYNLWQGTFETNKVWSRWSDFPDEIFYSEQEKSKIISLDKTFNSQLQQGSMKIIDTDRIFMRMAFDRILNHPLKCFKNWLTKIPRLWYQFYIQMYTYKEPSGIYFIFYFLFALYALFSADRENGILILPIVLLFIYLTLVFLPLHVEPRFGVALMPAIICLTAIGTWKVFHNFLLAKFVKK